MVQNLWEKNLDFIENSNFISHLSADVLLKIHGKIPLAESFHRKVAGLNPVSLLQ